MRASVAKRLKREAGYTGESWYEDQTFHPVFHMMAKGKKLYAEVTDPIKLKLGSKTLYKEKKRAYKTNI